MNKHHNTTNMWKLNTSTSPINSTIHTPFDNMFESNYTHMAPVSYIPISTLWSPTKLIAIIQGLFKVTESRTIIAGMNHGSIVKNEAVG